MRARAEGLRDFGAVMAPQNAFHILQGVETLPLRMERHMANPLKVLDILQGANAVPWVLHPDLPDHPDHALGRKLMHRGCAYIVSFAEKGGRKAGAIFIEACLRATLLAHTAVATKLGPPTA